MCVLYHSPVEAKSVVLLPVSPQLSLLLKTPWLNTGVPHPIPQSAKWKFPTGTVAKFTINICFCVTYFLCGLAHLDRSGGAVRVRERKYVIPNLGFLIEIMYKMRIPLRHRGKRENAFFSPKALEASGTAQPARGFPPLAQHTGGRFTV